MIELLYRFAHVRKQASMNLAPLLKAYDEVPSKQGEIIKTINETFYFSNVYFNRIAYIYMAASVMNTDKSLFSKHMKDNLCNLALDRVSNVRIILAKVLTEHIQNEGEFHFDLQFNKALYLLKRDKDKNVGEFMHGVVLAVPLDNIERALQQEGSMHRELTENVQSDDDGFRIEDDEEEIKIGHMVQPEEDTKVQEVKREESKKEEPKKEEPKEEEPKEEIVKEIAKEEVKAEMKEEKPVAQVLIKVNDSKPLFGNTDLLDDEEEVEEKKVEKEKVISQEKPTDNIDIKQENKAEEKIEEKLHEDVQEKIEVKTEEVKEVEKEIANPEPKVVNEEIKEEPKVEIPSNNSEPQSNNDTTEDETPVDPAKEPPVIVSVTDNSLKFSENDLLDPEEEESSQPSKTE